MPRPKLLMLKGLQGSGKSTKAKELTKQGYIRTNKDEIRELLFKGNYKRKDEKIVLRIRDDIISDALSHKKSVVVDDTNLNPIHQKALEQLAKEYDAEFEVDDSFLEVPIEECIKRDLKRLNSVGERVIRDTYHKMVKTPVNAPEYDPNLPMVVICDLDGTLCDMSDKRGPHDLSKVGLDEANAGVAHVLDAIKFAGYAKIFLFSGRDEVCRPETEEWLERNDIEYDFLAMRRSDHIDDRGNKVKDTIVKREMLEKYVLGKYNVLFIMDDRPSVCRQWRDVFGLTVMQLGDVHMEF